MWMQTAWLHCHNCKLHPPNFSFTWVCYSTMGQPNRDKLKYCKLKYGLTSLNLVLKWMSCRKETNVWCCTFLQNTDWFCKCLDPSLKTISLKMLSSFSLGQSYEIFKKDPLCIVFKCWLHTMLIQCNANFYCFKIWLFVANACSLGQ